MKRNALIYLEKWLNAKTHKPLVLRGARQVGKTWLVRELARSNNKTLIELNFEKNPGFKDFFATNDPAIIFRHLESKFDQPIKPKNSLLFLDEIQAFPELLAKLRWFYEEMPELPVIAAGSLLEFVIANHTFSMPVGRITYMHLEPLSFEEFLLANHREQLIVFLHNYKFGETIPSPIHDMLLQFFKEYLLVGGLPAAVSDWIDHHSPTNLARIQSEILTTYRDDFSKYAGKLSTDHLEEILQAAPQLLGNKFVFKQVNPTAQSESIKKALDLLCKARVCHRIPASYANGIPLGAGLNQKMFKVILLDAGLVSAILDLRLHQITQIQDINLINQGGVSEQIVGQLLRTISPFYIEPKLYYWTRFEAGASAEIDYLIQHQTQLIPIEVKSGATGSLKSLHYFMSEKKLSLAARINSDYPSVTPVELQTTTGKKAKYTLFSIPFYLTEQIHRLIDSLVQPPTAQTPDLKPPSPSRSNGTG